MKTKIYFALWAEDINAYLSTGYNVCTISDVKKALLDYTSVDQDNPKNIRNAPLLKILKMTGLALDYLPEPFSYSNQVNHVPIHQRIGYEVALAFIA